VPIVQVLDKHLERFFTATESDDGASPLPAASELNAGVACGILDS
jgi:hypothetical protein